VSEFADFKLMDKYYDEVLDHLAFNYEECCGDQFPDGDETVFH